MRILVVCTANICRSASAEALLRDAVAAHAELAGVEVRSAGTHAIQGLPGCRIAPALAGRSDEHLAQALTPELVEWADLILTAAREHRAAVVAMDPHARSKVFTLRQAGRIARWLVESDAEARSGEGSDPALTGALAQAGRAVDLRAIVEEMDAARGLAPIEDDERGVRGEAGEPDARGWRGWLRRGLGDGPDEEPAEGPHPDDIVDPHVHGTGFHAQAGAQVEESVGALVGYLISARRT